MKVGDYFEVTKFVGLGVDGIGRITTVFDNKNYCIQGKLQIGANVILAKDEFVVISAEEMMLRKLSGEHIEV